ncbi:MAG TPA: hypothetical protein DCQ04_01900 [Actinobacteria bacterium]|nr:hypothetical protein [Actinomycetota bacterium]
MQRSHEQLSASPSPAEGSRVPQDTVPGKAHAAATGSLALGAAGVVFGDIGTSPIYAFRESIAETTTGIDEAALGTASLAIWAVTLVVSVKYLMFVMKASNEGEGGILATSFFDLPLNAL